MKEQKLPPKWINSLLLRFCKPELLEEIEGDLLEYYQLWVEKYGRKKANRLYVLHTIKFLRPFAIKKSKSNNSNQIDMLQHYFKIAWRNLLKNAAFSTLNIFGLSIGLATCFLLMLFVFDESKYDQHHQYADRIFRVAQLVEGEKWAGTPAPLAQGMKLDLAEVENATRILNFPNTNKMLLVNEQNEKQFYETNGYYVDPSFFNVFTYDFINGNIQTALYQPNSLVISEELADKLFEKEDPINRTITVEIPYGKLTYTVKGVFRNNQHKSHINAHFFLSMENGDIGQWVMAQTNWATNSIFHTYIKLSEKANIESFEKKLPGFLERNAGSDLQDINVSKSLFIQPVTDIYLKSNIGYELSANGSTTYIYIFGSFAAFVLLIASINFMNLSTAQSEKKAKEVGLRKVIGAYKQSLIGQFLTESVMMSCLALILAIAIIQLTLPIFNDFTSKNIAFLQDPILILWMSGLAVFTGLLAGSYPALYLSSFKPVATLKGKLVNSISAIAIRKGLVVFQFVVSITLIIVATVIWQQLDFIKNQDLGFKKDQQIVLPFQSTTTANNYGALKNEILKNPKIISASAGSSYPGIQLIEDRLFYAEGKTMNEKVDIHLVNTYEDYIQTLGYELLYGRSLSNILATDSKPIVLNETAIRHLGYDASDAIGKKVFYEINKERHTMEIVGIVKDFNYRSLHESISPYGIIPFGGVQPNYFIASIRPGSLDNIVAEIEEGWKKINPNTPFEYSFLDQDFQRNYEKEGQISEIVIFFTVIAVFVACLGLFGLATFTTEQRRKEVGIRKILGASIMGIATLLSKEFVKLVGIAIIIACPISYYLGNQWLQDFAYQIDISWGIFVLSNSLALLIAIVTVGYQVVKSAARDPVKNLRSE